MDLYLDQQNIDTTTLMGRLLFQVTGAFAEFERSMPRRRVQVGLDSIKAKITKDKKFVTKARHRPPPPWMAWRRTRAAGAGQATAGSGQGHGQRCHRLPRDACISFAPSGTILTQWQSVPVLVWAASLFLEAASIIDTYSLCPPPYGPLVPDLV